MRTLALVALCSVWLPSFAVHAKSKSDSLDKDAKKACSTGDFRKGVEILADLYVRTDDTTFIFNQGRCYEQNHQWTAAIDRFREYLRKTPNRAGDAGSDAEKHIADCKALLAEEEGKTAPPTMTPPSIVVPPAPASPPSAPDVSSPAISPPIDRSAPSAETRSMLPMTGIVVGSVGLALLATGVVLNLKANQAANDGNKSSMNSYRNGSYVGYGVGGAALATGIVLFLVGRGGQPKTVALLPVWTPGGAALALGGEF